MTRTPSLTFTSAEKSFLPSKLAMVSICTELQSEGSILSKSRRPRPPDNAQTGEKRSASKAGKKKQLWLRNHHQPQPLTLSNIRHPSRTSAASAHFSASPPIVPYSLAMQAISRRIVSLSSRRLALSSFSTTSTKVVATGLDVINPTIGLTEEQAEFYTLARQFADNELRPHAQKWDEEHDFPVETFKKCADLGFAGISIKDEVGGTGLSRLDNVTIIEALATGCVGTTAMVSIHNMCAGMIDKFGTEEQRSYWLPKMCKLDIKASYCLTEPGSGSDASSLVTKADFDPATNEYVVNGGKAFISGAGMSDIYLVMCRTGKPGPGGISCLIIPKDTKGVSFGALEKKMGWNVSPTRQVIFEDVRIPASNRLGAEGEGFKMAMTGLDGGRLSIGACSVGAAQACFEIALAYVKERKQFKKSIAEYQVTQFKLADMAGKISTSRLALRHAAKLLDEGHPAATAHCALAKKIATDQCFEVCNEALQLHGGYGYLKDYQVERYVRDCRVNQILEGTNEIMRHIVGRALVA